MDDKIGRTGSASAATAPEATLPRAISGWIRIGTLDAELAALTSILVERGLPLVVAAASGSRAGGSSGLEAADALRQALLACLVPAPGARTPSALTVDGGSLESVLVRIPTLSLDSVDESGARVAIVAVLATDDEADTWRAAAVHLLRAPLRDAHGHVQRQGPAVLSTWDGASRRFEHFSWAVLAELALLVDERAGDLEIAVDRRAGLLAGLVAHRVEVPGAVRLAIEAARAEERPSHRH